MLGAAVISSAFIGCSKSSDSNSNQTITQKDPKDYKGEITFWHFNKDEAPVLVKHFTDKYPNVKVKLQVISDQNQGYQNKITTTLASGGSGMPDVYCGESAFVKRFVNANDGFEDLSQSQYKLDDVTKNMAKYTVDIGTDDKGKVRALTYQITPGGIGYKRDLAKKYFGTDDPDQIGSMMSSVDKLIDMAKQLKDKSNGSVKFFPARQEIERIYLGARQTGWVKDNKLVIDPMMDKYVETAKIMRDNKLEAGYESWSQPWTTAVAGNDVFAYAIPTWGVANIIAADDPSNKDTGRWALAKAPINYWWGGTWLGVYSKSKNKDLAWQFVKSTVSDEDSLKSWTQQTGDIINDTKLIGDLAQGSDVNKTTNQNLNKFFQPLITDINGTIFTQYDDKITADWDDNMATYLSGKISKDDFYAKFKEKVKSDFPKLTVE